MSKPKNAPAHHPWTPPTYELADVAAIQALVRGDATDVQQKRALNWIIFACGTYDLSYRPDSARDTDFALGKQFVGQQIVKLTKLDLATLQRTQTQQS